MANSGIGVNQGVPTSFVANNELNYLTSSDLINVYAKASPDVRQQLVEPFGDENLGIMDLLEDLGQVEEAVFGNEYNHFEQGRLKELVKASAETSNDGSVAVIAITDTRDIPFSSQTWYSNTPSASTKLDVQVGDTVWIPVVGGNAVETQVVGEGTADGLSAGEIKIQKVKSSDTIPTITTSTEMFIGGNAFAEGSGQPNSREVRTYKYTNYIQTFKSTYEINGASLGQQAFITMPNGSKYWYVQGIMNTRRFHRNQIEAAFLAGNQIDVTSTATLANTFKTEGLIPAMQANGNTEGYTAGSLSITDIDSMIAKLKKFRGASENLLVGGNEFITGVDDIIRTSEGMKAGGIQYAGIGGEDRGVRFGFDHFIRSGVTFHYKSLQAFDDPDSFGATNSSFAKLGLVIPTGNTTSYNYGRQVTSVPTMRMVYLSVDGESNGYKEWVTGSAGAVSTNQTDAQQINMRDRKGFEVFGLNRFGVFDSNVA
jgi:hypothetical protein